MRILHVIQRYWPYTGGSERHLQEISERLAAEGHAVTLYTTDALDLELFWNPAKRRIPVRAESHNGVLIRRFPVRHLPVPGISFAGIRRAMAGLSDLPLDLSSLLVRMSSLAPWVPELSLALQKLEGEWDVIHGMNICFESLLYPAFTAARRTGAAFVVTPLTHLGEANDPLVRRYYTMRHQVDLVKQSDVALVQTDIERDYLIGRGVSEHQLAKAGVGVNPEDVLGGVGERFRQKYGVNGPIVVYLGTLAYDKGTFHLVEAMRRLWEAGVSAELVLAGPSMDPFVRFLQTQPDSIRNRVRALGVISEESKRDLLAASSILAMPSRTDSFGIVFLEAWLYGKPVIGAIAGGVPEVIDDGKDGYLVPFGDVEALASRLVTLLDDPRAASAMGECGRQKTLDRYTWDRIYPVVRDTYERVVSRRRTAPSADLTME